MAQAGLWAHIILGQLPSGDPLLSNLQTGVELGIMFVAGLTLLLVSMGLLATELAGCAGATGSTPLAWVRGSAVLCPTPAPLLQRMNLPLRLCRALGPLDGFMTGEITPFDAPCSPELTSPFVHSQSKADSLDVHLDGQVDEQLQHRSTMFERLSQSRSTSDFDRQASLRRPKHVAEQRP